MDIPIQRILGNLTDDSWDMLKLIDENPTITFKEIRVETNLSQEKAYKTLAFLEGALLITNKRKTDARFTCYEITEYGKYALANKN